MQDGKVTQPKYIKYQGASLFRYRLVFATLTHKPIIIENIRMYDEKPGITDYELNFLHLLDSITHHSLIEINENGTRIRYNPGTLLGSNKLIEHKCVTSRGLSYWIEPLLLLLPFAKHETTISLIGATYHDSDVSIDIIRGVLLPTLNRIFGIQDIKLDLKRRSLQPTAGGEILLRIPIIQKLKTINSVDVGMIKRVRGLCYTIAMTPTISNRIRVACNNTLYQLINDVWIFNDSTSRHDLQQHLTNDQKDDISSGYGLSLIAESTNGVLISVHQQCDNNKTAEEFGEYVSKLLLQEISYGGTVDTSLQGIILIFMALCPEDVSRIRLGRISQHTVQILRLIRDMLGVTFKLKEDEETGTIFASCMGIGYCNIWRQAS